MSSFFFIYLLLSGLPKALFTFIVSSFTSYPGFSSLPLTSFLVFACASFNYRVFLSLLLPCSGVLLLFFLLNVIEYGFTRDLVFFFIATFSNLLLFIQSSLLRPRFSNIPTKSILNMSLSLLSIQTLGFLIAPASIASQLFSGQFIPIASILSLIYISQSPSYRPRYSNYLLLPLVSFCLLYFSQARSTLIISFFSFILCLVFLVLSRFSFLIPLTNLLRGLSFPTKLVHIFFSLAFSFILYCFININFFNTFFSGQPFFVSSYISHLESCDYSDKTSSEFCDPATSPLPTSDVSILVRTSSDCVFSYRLLRSPLDFVLPFRIIQDSSTPNYNYRSHNLIIFWIQNFGIFGLCALLYTLYLSHRYITSYFSLALTPVALPIIIMCFFTLNDLFVLLPFVIYQSSSLSCGRE